MLLFGILAACLLSQYVIASSFETTNYDLWNLQQLNENVPLIDLSRRLENAFRDFNPFTENDAKQLFNNVLAESVAERVANIPAIDVTPLAPVTINYTFIFNQCGRDEAQNRTEALSSTTTSTPSTLATSLISVTETTSATTQEQSTGTVLTPRLSSLLPTNSPTTTGASYISINPTDITLASTDITPRGIFRTTAPTEKKRPHITQVPTCVQGWLRRFMSKCSVQLTTESVIHTTSEPLVVFNVIFESDAGVIDEAFADLEGYIATEKHIHFTNLVREALSDCTQIGKRQLIVSGIIGQDENSSDLPATKSLIVELIITPGELPVEFGLTEIKVFFGKLENA